MLIRKMATAYFISCLIILFFSLLTLDVAGADWTAPGDMLAWAGVVAIYAVPTLFLYGILVSALLELVVDKWRISPPTNWYILGTAHAAMGFVFGLVLEAPLFSIIGATAALAFYFVDRMIAYGIHHTGRRTKAVLLAAPIIIFALALTLQYSTAPPKPPFTAADAVAFATEGEQGTLTDLFPDEVGVVKLQVDGYEVERETAVEPIANKKEHYLIYFIERWHKDDDKGEHVMMFEVSRGQLVAAGSEGQEPPYRR